MPAVVFLTHIPLLRLAEDELPFAGGELTRLPWELYDSVSLGAFEDFRALYEQTAPVFFRTDHPDLTAAPVRSAPAEGGMVEVTAPSPTWDWLLPNADLALLLNYANAVVEPAWTALLLAAPAAAPAWPRMSVTFAVRGDDATSFDVEGHRYDGVRVHGEAGQEMLFSPRAAGAEVTAATVARADDLVELVTSAARHPELRAALGALQASAHPSLSADERTTLAVTALESLLLPEVVSGLGATFARRIAMLLSPTAEHGALEKVARALYDARSASLHGGSARAIQAAPPGSFAYGPRLLAAAIETLARAVGEDGDVGAICSELDARAPAGAVAASVADDVGARATDRLSARPPTFAVGYSLGPTMEARDGTVLSWSPLVGLACDQSVDVSREEGVFLTARNPQAILSMEDKDVRRELGDVALAETTVACLGVARPGELGDATAMLGNLLRVRDRATAALRLSGFAAFTDPELLGSYVFEGRTRTIATSILGPTILRGMAKEPMESFAEADRERLAANWQLLTTYEDGRRHPDIDHVLTLLRRTHDDTFLPAAARAGLLLATVEAMLGRFRPHEDPMQLEDLVRQVAGAQDPHAEWFAEHARALRNAVAHGYWDGDREPLASLQALLAPLVSGFVRTWVLDAGGDDRRPGRVFIDAASAALLA
jgi:hypothetical protein